MTPGKTHFNIKQPDEDFGSPIICNAFDYTLIFDKTKAPINKEVANYLSQNIIAYEVESKSITLTSNINDKIELSMLIATFRNLGTINIKINKIRDGVYAELNCDNLTYENLSFGQSYENRNECLCLKMKFKL